MKNVIAFTLCFFFFFLCVLHAQSGYYLKIDGIEGESTTKGYEGWSDIEAFSQSIHQADGGATGAARRRSAAVLEDMILVKEMDQSSPKLQEAVSSGKHFPKVEIHLTTTSGGGARVVYCSYELKNAMITSYNLSGGREEVPTEELAIDFEEIKVVYTKYDSRGRKTGNVEYSWKVEKGTK